ncbi:MAG: glycosyltransferase family 2 protein [Bdellovibrionales bacterium]|nr:glycosyltransferase family 2 protein [Bdellovibrionales bacterium]
MQVKTPEKLGESELPHLALFIAAYNEENVIQRKLENSLELSYPMDKLQIIVGSDGSNDQTNEIVQSYAEKYPHIQLLKFPRMGKSNIINAAIKTIDSELVVFSDANTIYEKDSLRIIARYLVPEGVGCVCGRLIYHNPGNIMSGVGESFYWNYETKLKIMESQVGYVAGANGAIYAIKRPLFSELPQGTINDDFYISMKVVEKGYKSLYAEDAKAYEEVAPSMGGEFRRHIRDGAGHYLVIPHLLKLVNPLIGMRSFIFWSHRLLRWMAPFILLLMFVANIYLASVNAFYQLLFVFHVAFYILAFSGLIMSRFKKVPFVLYAPFYFCNLNLALFLGFLKAISGRQKVTWNSTERSA